MHKVIPAELLVQLKYDRDALPPEEEDMRAALKGCPEALILKVFRLTGTLLVEVPACDEQRLKIALEALPGVRTARSHQARSTRTKPERP